MRSFVASDIALDGVNLVEASAGTGKTHAITTLLLRLLLQRELTIEQVLVVTFTEAATKELRARVRDRLSRALLAFEAPTCPDEDADIRSLWERSEDRPLDAARLRLALRDVDEASVFTIHGFCHRTLLDSAFASGTPFDAELVSDTQPMRDEVVQDFFASLLATAPQAEVQLLRSAKLAPAQVSKLVERATRAPDMLVVPAQVELAPLDAGPLREALASVAGLWDGDEIRHRLSAGVLNRNSYPDDKIAAWCDAMDRYLAVHAPRADEDVVPPVFERLDKFRASKLVAKTNKNKTPPAHPFFDACDVLAEAIEDHESRSRGFAIAVKRQLVEYVRREMPRRMRRARALSFDDLLLRLAAALEGPGGRGLAAQVARRYPVALIDEFQDTDAIQDRIFASIYDQGTLFLIGDPKQAIYAFRGADVFTYMRAAGRVASERRFTMGTNWRSDERLVDAVTELFGRTELPFVLSDITFPAVRARPGAGNHFHASADLGVAPLQLLFAAREGGHKLDASALPQAMAAEVADLLRPSSGTRIDTRPLSPRDVAVLTRTNAQAFEVQSALRELGVPSVVLGDQSVFEKEQPEAAELERVLAAVAEPTNASLLRTALCTDLLGMTASRLVAMEEETDPQLSDNWDWWVDRFREWHRRWSQRGFVQMMRAVMVDAGVLQRLLALPGGERRVTNLLHVVELLHTAASTEHLGPAGLVGWLRQQRLDAAARPDAAQIRLESDEDAVKLTTIHKSKGLEYPVVVCPYLWDGRLLRSDDKRELVFHDPASDDAMVLDLDPESHPEHLRRAEQEALAESLRLLYVALTRAKHRALVVWGAFAGYATSSLGYLLHAKQLGGVTDVGLLKASLARLDDDAMRDVMDDLAVELAGKLEVRPLSLARRGEALELDAQSRPALRHREVMHPVRRWWRMASFTTLASSRHAPTVGSSDGLDRDEQALPSPLAGAPVGVSRSIRLLDFPRGPRAGTFFHALLEELDFAAVHDDGEGTASLVDAKLRAFGYDPAHADVVVAALRDVVDTPIANVRRRRLRLRDVARQNRRDELEFYLPVASATREPVLPRGTQLSLVLDPSRAAPARRLTARRLADVFVAHPSSAVPSSYASELEKLSFAALEGFLKGYIDLIFEHDGRWYLVDYKSNHLGDEIAAYTSSRLPTAMVHGHYYLQYHLYSVALHRLLSNRLVGYDYDEHFGGVFYLFLKGMTPDSGTRSGVFFEKPPRGRIVALSELLERPWEGGS